MPTPTRIQTRRIRLAAVLLLPALAAQAATLAYYRFEDPSLAEITDPVGDASGNGRSLHPWGPVTRTADVPAATVPGNGLRNLASVRFHADADLYLPPDADLGPLSPVSFTIEAWIKFDSMEGIQTFIGRDDTDEGAGRQSLFYLSKETDRDPFPGRTANALRLELVTRDNQLIEINSTHVVEPGMWSHVAVVGDSGIGMLSLYADGRMIGSCPGFSGLFVPSRHGVWTLGRGQFNGRVADRFHGWLDEVRFSDEALKPDGFLNAAPPPPVSVVAAPEIVPPPPEAIATPEGTAAPLSPKAGAARDGTSRSEDTADRRHGPLWPARR